MKNSKNELSITNNGGGVFLLRQSQVVNSDVKKLWKFISNPKNLNELTPKDLQFQILTKNLPQNTYNGMIIEYLIKLPLLGNKNWLTEIKAVIEEKQFIDEQRIGPYKMWYHRHAVEKISKEKTLMIDEIYYIPPFGFLGKIVNFFFIKRKLKQIFSYREKKMKEIF